MPNTVEATPIVKETDWETLSKEQQEKLCDRAAYMIEHGYISWTDGPMELARYMIDRGHQTVPDLLGYLEGEEEKSRKRRETGEF